MVKKIVVVLLITIGVVALGESIHHPRDPDNIGRHVNSFLYKSKEKFQGIYHNSRLGMCHRSRGYHREARRRY